METEWLTANEAALYLKVQPRTVLKWAKEGRVPAHPLSGSKRVTWRFLKSWNVVHIAGVNRILNISSSKGFRKFFFVAPLLHLLPARPCPLAASCARSSANLSWYLAVSASKRMFRRLMKCFLAASGKQSLISIMPPTHGNSRQPVQ
jgi:excisionase family DNA binding protein